MTNAQVLRYAQSGFAGRIAAYFADLRAARKRQAVYRQTLRELNALSDRDLTDMGISRWTLESVAREAAYGT
ncbi:MAG: DUF1127 domain-containing protein [Paracoccaceae bacterium]